MRKYTLASPTAKDTVDLRDYEDTITKAVHQVIPKAVIRVEQCCYYVEPTPNQGEAVRIGRLICQSDIKQYCVQIPKLFSSVEIEEENDESGEQKCNGGHF